MSLSLSVDPGGEQFVTFAKKKLKQWHAEMLRTGQQALARTMLVDTGDTIYFNSLHLGNEVFRDRIRITSGQAYIGADPFQPLWGVSSALMPGTRPSVTPALAWSPATQHITAFFPENDGSYLRRHWLVICRYCRRVAQYSWDETKVFTDSTKTAFTITGAFYSYSDPVLTLRDTDAGGNIITRTITTTLTADSDSNPWGWIDGPDSPGPIHPGAEPSTTPYSYSSSQSTTFTTDGTTYANTVIVTTYTISNGTSSQTIVYTGQVYVQYNVPVPGQNTTTVSGDYLSNIGWLLPGTYVNAQPSIDSSGHQLAAVTALVASLNAAQNAAHALWLQACVTDAISIWQNILSMLDAKKFGATADVTELRPWDGATAHEDLQSATVFGFLNSATFTATLGSLLQDISYNNYAPPPVVNAYGVTIALKSPAVPAPPDTPYHATVGVVDTHTYLPSSKSFSAAVQGPTPTYYFSRGSDVTGGFGGLGAMYYGGLYVFSGDSAATTTFKTGLGAALDQTQRAALSTAGSYTSAVILNGAGEQRQIRVAISGSWSGVVTLQSSPNSVIWSDVATFTSNTAAYYVQDFAPDGSYVYYRLGFNPSAYQSGVAQCVLYFWGPQLYTLMNEVCVNDAAADSNLLAYSMLRNGSAGKAYRSTSHLQTSGGGSPTYSFNQLAIP